MDARPKHAKRVSCQSLVRIIAVGVVVVVYLAMEFIELQKTKVSNAQASGSAGAGQVHGVLHDSGVIGANGSSKVMPFEAHNECGMDH